jgi:hypothetical protein
LVTAFCFGFGCACRPACGRGDCQVAVGYTHLFVM